MFKITKAHRDNAKKLGLSIKKSQVSGKKLDVYKDSIKIASIGAKGYSDYQTYKRTDGKAYADKRRALYHARHKKEKKYNSKKELTPGYLASKILW